MIRALPLLLLLSGAAEAEQGIELAQLRIEQQVIIRVPLVPPPRPPVVRPADPPAVVWREEKGPKCLKMKEIRAADAEIGNDSRIDILMGDSKRYRATLEAGCRSADFYVGFYMEPTKDGSLCAGRDVIQARGGAECRIQHFRHLVAAK